MQINILQRICFLIRTVRKADMMKINRTILHLGNSLRRRNNITLFIQYLINTLYRRKAHGQHNKNHRQHHQ